MSVTVRLWNDTDLAAAKRGSDLWLTTLLLNKGTYNQDEMKAYPRELRKVYYAQFQEGEPVKFYAPNDEMALKFLECEYLPGSFYEVWEEICTTRMIYEA